MEGKINRRQLVNSAAVASLSLAGLPTLTESAIAAENTEVGSEIVEKPFLEIGITAEKPNNAIIADRDRKFPSFIPGVKTVYLPTESATELSSSANGVITATASGLEELPAKTGLPLKEVPLDKRTEGRGTVLESSRITSGISLDMDSNVAKVAVGDKQVAARKGETRETEIATEIEYQKPEQKVTELVNMTVSLSNHGTKKIIGHQDYTIIPKSTPGGANIRKEIAPKIKNGKRIGNIIDVVNLEGINAWGIEFGDYGGVGK